LIFLVCLHSTGTSVDAFDPAFYELVKSHGGVKDGGDDNDNNNEDEDQPEISESGNDEVGDEIMQLEHEDISKEETQTTAANHESLNGQEVESESWIASLCERRHCNDSHNAINIAFSVVSVNIRANIVQCACFGGSSEEEALVALRDHFDLIEVSWNCNFSCF